MASRTSSSPREDVGRSITAESSAVKCLVGKLLCLSPKEMEIQLSDVSTYREAMDEMDTGPSLEDIIVSMQQHLQCAGEESVGDVVYQRSRGNESARAAAGGVTSTPRAAVGGVTPTPQLSHTVYTAPWTYANNRDGIFEDDDPSECDEVPLPVLTREILRCHTNAKTEYAEVETDHGQDISFLENDRVRGMLDEEEDGEEGDEFLNPVAHPRLSTPFYQQLRVKYPQAFQRRSSITSMTSELSSICPHDSPNGCSPENGLSTRPPLPPCSRKGVNFCVEGFRSDGEDISIVGMSPRSHHELSFERDSVPTFLQGILKKDAPLSSCHSVTNDTSERSLPSLKERLKRNRETFRHLMSDENSPFGRRKKSSSLPKDKMDVSAVLISSNGMQNVCIDEHVSKRSLTPGSSRKHVRTKRFASPDSTHDSAVDMDSASMQSGQLDTQLSNGLCLCLLKAHEQNNNARGTTSSLKLRCRQKTRADHNSDWPVMGKPPTGFIMANYGKDSDDDSGIAYGCQSDPHIADCRHREDPIDSRMSDEQTRPLHDHPSRPTRTIREDHSTPAISTMDEQLDLSGDGHKDLHVKLKGVDICHDGEIDIVERTMPSSGRSSSLTQKHREVTFEDEIHRQSLHRACSQPLLNSNSDLPSGGRTLHRVLHFGGEIGDSQSCRHNVVDDLNRYHSEDDLMNSHERHSHRRRMHHEHISRRKCSSPTARVNAVDDTIESSMEVHRASPAVVLSVSTNEHVRNKPPRPPGGKTRQHRFQSRMSPGSSFHSSERATHTLSDTELDREVMRANGFITNGPGLTSTQSDRKRFHFPWRKNRGRYTPSEEIIKMEKSRGQNASLSSLTPSDISSNGQRIARGASKLRQNGQRASTRSNVCEMTSESGANYERVRQFSGSVDSVNSFCSENASSVSPESDYENVDSIKNTNKQSTKLPSGQRSRQNRHDSVTSDGNYAVVMNGSRFVTTAESNGRGRSTSHIESDYETVDAITKPNIQHYDRQNSHGSLRGPNKYQANGNSSAQQDRTHAVYAEVDFSRKTRKNASCATTECDESISTLPLPPVPFRGYESDLQRHRGLSSSRSSLADKVGGFRRSVKRKFSRLRRAVSLDRLDKTEGPVGEPTVGMAGGRWKSPSLTSLTAVFKKKKNRDGERPGSKQLSRDARRQSSSMTALNDTRPPKKCQPIGTLQKINLDGTQIVHLMKPADGPFGFYIARGSAKYNHAVFVSRLCDSLPANFFAGLLNIGDEIIEINGTSMKKLSLEETYDLMARQDELRLKILPFMARRDV